MEDVCQQLLQSDTRVSAVQVYIRKPHVCMTGVLDSVGACGWCTSVQYSNCGRGPQTSALASQPRAHEGAQRAQVTYPSLSGQV